jgi:hypothetical protein
MLNVFGGSEGRELMSEKTIREYKMREAQSVRRLLGGRENIPDYFLHSLMPFQFIQPPL